MKYTVEQFLSDLKNPYAWPGCCPRFFITSDGEALSFKAAEEEKLLIIESIKNQLNDGWTIVGCDINWEDDSLYCAHTGEKIESAYSE